MVGGYSSIDTQLLLSTEIMDVGNLALKEFASKFASSDNDFADASSFVVLPQDVESGNVVIKVLEAQRQVSNFNLLIRCCYAKVLTSYVHFYFTSLCNNRLWQV